MGIEIQFLALLTSALNGGEMGWWLNGSVALSQDKQSPDIHWIGDCVDSTFLAFIFMQRHRLLQHYITKSIKLKIHINRHRRMLRK